MKDAVKKVMYFDTDALLDEVVALLSNGKSVVVMTELYLGNGKWKLDKYRYKMLVPVADKSGCLYSTDVFPSVENAIAGEYGIYRATRQNAKKVVMSLEADISNERYGWGYTEEKYGRQVMATV